MFRQLKSKKAQAAVELAIIGALIILAYSYLITFTAKVNITQKQLQGVFRNMLQAGNVTGDSFANAAFFQRMPNILDPYTPGTLKPIEASGKVHWASGKSTDNVDINLEAQWYGETMQQSGTYTKTFTRTEAPGSYPITNRTVELGNLTRSGP